MVRLSLNCFITCVKSQSPFFCGRHQIPSYRLDILGGDRLQQEPYDDGKVIDGSRVQCSQDGSSDRILFGQTLKGEGKRKSEIMVTIKVECKLKLDSASTTLTVYELSSFINLHKASTISYRYFKPKREGRVGGNLSLTLCCASSMISGMLFMTCFLVC